MGLRAGIVEERKATQGNVTHKPPPDPSEGNKGDNVAGFFFARNTR